MPHSINGNGEAETSEENNVRHVEYLDRELTKYKKCLESMRPKEKPKICRTSSVHHLEKDNSPYTRSCDERYDIESDSNGSDDFEETYEQVPSKAPVPHCIADDRSTALNFRIQESLSVTRLSDDGGGGGDTVTQIMSKKIHSSNHPFDGAISLDHCMSISIRRLDPCDSNESFHNNESHCNDVDAAAQSEQQSIIKALFDRTRREDRTILQKYFMKWTHFTTIEKLTKRNPDRSRLQKMEIFLENITMERKKTLQKLKEINRTESMHQNASKSKAMDSSELMARKFNNK